MRLARLDPAAEARIARNDRQRLLRALSVAIGTGRALSDWQADTSPALPPALWRGLVLAPPRDALYARCDARVETMVAAGALDEVAALAARGLSPDLPVMKAVGFREMAGCLAGSHDLAFAIAATRQETRRYAKRQSTWFRNQTPDWPRIEAVEAQAQAAALFSLWP